MNIMPHWLKKQAELIRKYLKTDEGLFLDYDL